MADAHYSGTRQTANEVTYALAQAGYQIVGSTPNTPRAASDFWRQARELFRAERLEQGGPRDYRVHLRDPEGANQFLQVKPGSRVRATGVGQVAMGAPATEAPTPGLTLWQSARGNDTREVFAWNGTEIGFSDLIAFFQLNGSLLNDLRPSESTAGLQILVGTATRYRDGEVYEFSLTRDTLFSLGESGSIETITAAQLRARYLPADFGADPEPFQETPFAQTLFEQGIVLAPVEERAGKPWYKRWYVWLLAAVVAAIIAIFAIMLGSGGAPRATETPTPEPTATAEPEPAPDPEPDGGSGSDAGANGDQGADSGSGPSLPELPEIGSDGGSDGWLPEIELPEIELPWESPDWQWPWESPDWQWPWEN